MVNDFDPTTNRIQFGLLNESEQKALKAWPHGWEYNNNSRQKGWFEATYPAWHEDVVYRGKPAPVVVSRYLNLELHQDGFTSRSFADSVAGPNRIAVVRIDTCNGVSTAHLEEV